MEKLFLTGCNKKMKDKQLHLFLPFVKQPVDLPSDEPARSIEKQKRNLISEDTVNLSKLTMAAVQTGMRSKGYWFHVCRFKMKLRSLEN